jgi:hypothetical protein
VVALLGTAPLAMPHFTQLEEHVLLGRLLQARCRGRAVAIVGGRRHAAAAAAAAARVRTDNIVHGRGAHGDGVRVIRIVAVMRHPPGSMYGAPDGERQLWEGGVANELLIIY